MSLTSEQRQAIRISQEGNALQHAQQGDVKHAAEVARCVIDGWVNGLLRMEGPQETYKFMCALTDRVGDGIRGATMIPEALKKFQPAVEIASAPITEPERVPIASEPASIPFWCFGPIFVAGALIVAFAIQHGHWGE